MTPASEQPTAPVKEQRPWGQIIRWDGNNGFHHFMFYQHAAAILATITVWDDVRVNVMAGEGPEFARALLAALPEVLAVAEREREGLKP